MGLLEFKNLWDNQKNVLLLLGDWLESENTEWKGHFEKNSQNFQEKKSTGTSKYTKFKNHSPVLLFEPALNSLSLDLSTDLISLNCSSKSLSAAYLSTDGVEFREDEELMVPPLEVNELFNEPNAFGRPENKGKICGLVWCIHRPVTLLSQTKNLR